MKPTSDVTACIVDNGLFPSLAQRLAREFKRVLYFSEYQEGFSTINKAIVGDGLEGVERVPDIWSVKEDVDLFIFPDIEHSGLQLELESQGYAVWGARKGDRLELDREYFMRTLKDLELDVPTFTVIRGITALREHLRDQEDKFIKISKYRGSLETCHWRSWALDENLLDVWAVRFGGARELLKFLVFDAIDTPLEIGGDTYCVDGRWPSKMIHGIEGKDKTYFGAVTETEQMPDKLKVFLDAFKPILQSYRYRAAWSMEVRVLDDKAYFIDPTCRFGLPSSASQMELWANLGEIMWAGANGELVEPEPAAMFSAEISLKTHGEDSAWWQTSIPNELRQWVKFFRHCDIGETTWFPVDDARCEALGWLCAIGDNPKETLETLKGYVAKLPAGLEADLSALTAVIDEVDVAEEAGIEFSGDKPMPEAAEVLETP